LLFEQSEERANSLKALSGFGATSFGKIRKKLTVLKVVSNNSDLEDYTWKFL
jgi:hypothetical protein